MRHAVLALALLACSCLAAAPAVADEAPPLPMKDLLRLVEGGLGEEALGALVGSRGLEGPLGVEDLLALRAAGLSDAFLATLVRAGARAGAALAGVDVDVKDGVILVSGQGMPSAEGGVPVAEASSEGETSGAPTLRDPVEAGALSVALEAASHAAAAVAASVEERAPEPQPSAAHPLGAVFGPTGGAVFVPAAYGGQPSSFGKTIVAFAQPAACWPTVIAVPVAAAPQPPVPVPSDRYDRIPLRTSRGRIWVPN